MSTESSNPIDAAASFVHELNERRKVESANLPSNDTTEASTAENNDNQDVTTQPQGAIDPVTGDINWDCPCLADMIKPPCGETFKAAFSCFVYSQTEPKGMDCVDKFKDMQVCFKDHPEVYGRDEDEDDDEDN